MVKKFQFYIIYSVIFVSLLMTVISGSVLILSSTSFLPDSTGEFLSGANIAALSETALYLIFIQTLISFISVMVFKSLFKKTSSPEVFFILIALAGLSFEGIRSIVYISYFFKKMYTIQMILPRIIYFGKLISALTLFISGLFSTGFPIQKQNTFLGLSFIFSILLSSSVPIDFSANNSILLPGSSTPYIIQNVIFSLYILSLLNYTAAAYINKNRDFILTAAGIILFAAGIELSFPLEGGIFLISGFISMIIGISLTGYAINKIYSWM